MVPLSAAGIVTMTRRACAIAFAATATLGCFPATRDMIDSTLTASESTASDEDVTIPTNDALRRLATRRVYFAHQSVGGNLMAGVEALVNEHADVGLRVVQTREPATVSGPALIHFMVGRNEDPASKNADFLRVLDARADRDSAMVLMKYCYIDVNAGTDIDAVFRGYRELVAEVKARHPDVTLVHVTMPLTVDASGPKASLKRLLGRTTGREINQKRSHFNELLRREFAREPLFDLAALEATRSNGSLERVRVGDQFVYALAPEYTSDGGHLNASAERRFAARFLSVLASVPRRDVE